MAPIGLMPEKFDQCRNKTWVIPYNALQLAAQNYLMPGLDDQVFCEPFGSKVWEKALDQCSITTMYNVQSLNSVYWKTVPRLLFF